MSDTPIADNFFVSLPTEYDWSDTCDNKIEIADFCRRLERDRAALMESLSSILDSQSAILDRLRSNAESALAAARANFPTESHE